MRARKKRESVWNMDNTTEEGQRTRIACSVEENEDAWMIRNK